MCALQIFSIIIIINMCVNSRGMVPPFLSGGVVHNITIPSLVPPPPQNKNSLVALSYILKSNISQVHQYSQKLMFRKMFIKQTKLIQE